MAQFSRTWWGQRFIAALEQFTDPGRLARGRSYAHNGRILSSQMEHGKVTAKVRGNANPYFGIYEEPTYTTTVAFSQISAADWQKAIAAIASKAGYVSKLLMNEMPDTIEQAFAGLKLGLLPTARSDLRAKCSCPDDANPCKHIAGVYYLLASELDSDPFLLFELRGLSREQLRTELAKSPLGAILSSSLVEEELTVSPTPSYYTRPRPVRVDASPSYKEFWTGAKRLPAAVEATPPAPVPALLIKKQGDYPSFWPKDLSFITVMEELYERVRTKSPQMK
jgi:uncharacterized Zn finger protein